MNNFKKASAYFGYENRELANVKIMCIVEDYAMVRRKGAMPTVKHIKDLYPPIEENNNEPTTTPTNK